MTEEEPTSKLYKQCTTVYGLMSKDAEAKTEGTFWTGALTTLMTENGIGVGHYTHVTQKLIAMGCIEQVQRGGTSKPSIWCLITAPTPELFDLSAGASSTGKRLSKKANHSNAIQALEQRMTKVELALQKLYERVMSDKDTG